MSGNEVTIEKMNENTKVTLTLGQLKSLIAEGTDDNTENEIDELALALKRFVKEYGFRGLAKNMMDCFGFQDSHDCVKEPL